MNENHPLSDQRIIDCLTTEYGIEVAVLSLLPLGADMNSAVYRAEARDGSSYFIKLRHGQYQDISTTIISLLHQAGIEQLILPVKTIQGRLTQPLDGSTLIVFPFVEGRDGFSRDLSPDQWAALGKTLRKVHEIEVPQDLQALIRREAYSPKWREAVRGLYRDIEAESDGDELTTKMRAFMREHLPTIKQLVDRAQDLCQEIQDQTPEFVLCHSDIHGGNVLMDGNDLIYIVDWDDPIMAPKERDLMFVGAGVANVWNKPQEQEYFYQGYGKTEINKAILAYYRHERIVEDIALYGQHLLLSTAAGKERAESYQHFIAQFEPRGVVEIALLT